MNVELVIKAGDAEIRMIALDANCKLKSMHKRLALSFGFYLFFKDLFGSARLTRPTDTVEEVVGVTGVSL